MPKYTACKYVRACEKLGGFGGYDQNDHYKEDSFYKLAEAEDLKIIKNFHHLKKKN